MRGYGVILIGHQRDDKVISCVIIWISEHWQLLDRAGKPEQDAVNNGYTWFHLNLVLSSGVLPGISRGCNKVQGAVQLFFNGLDRHDVTPVLVENRLKITKTNGEARFRICTGRKLKKVGGDGRKANIEAVL